MVSVWSLFIRLFHWSLVAIVISNLWLNEAGDPWHNRLGYAAVVLIFLRLIYGFFGRSYSRWTSFLRGPREAFRYLLLTLKNKEPRLLTHNPLAAYGMIAMLLMVLGLGVSGYLLEETDRFFGDENMQELHEVFANILIGLIVIHLLGVILHIYRHRENIIVSMVTGLKPLDKDSKD